MRCHFCFVFIWKLTATVFSFREIQMVAPMLYFVLYIFIITLSITWRESWWWWISVWIFILLFGDERNGVENVSDHYYGCCGCNGLCGWSCCTITPSGPPSLLCVVVCICIVQRSGRLQESRKPELIDVCKRSMERMLCVKFLWWFKLNCELLSVLCALCISEAVSWEFYVRDCCRNIFISWDCVLWICVLLHLLVLMLVRYKTLTVALSLGATVQLINRL